MRDAAGAVAWMRDQHETGARGWKGLCLKACRTAWGLPGGTPDARTWWANVPDEHRHAWTETPPLGAPIYYEGGAHGHIVLADTTTAGQWGTDLPTTDRIGNAGLYAPRDQWGFRPMGWASWLNGYALPLAITPGTPDDPSTIEGEAMDYAEVTRRKPQTVGGEWAWLTLDNEVRDIADIHYRDGILSLASRRFAVDLSLTLTTPSGKPARVSVAACVVDNAGNVTTAYPSQSFTAGAGEVTARFARLSGYCSKDRRVRIRVRSLDATTEVTPYAVVFRYA